MRTIRSELFKFRTTPGPWVVVLINTGLTAVVIAGTLYASGGANGTGYNPHSVHDLRDLLGAGYQPAVVFALAPILGILCVTTEYRHKVLTTTLLVTPRRPPLLLAKAAATVVWAIYMCLMSFVLVFAWGIPGNNAAGGSTSALLHQVGAVLPGMLLVYALMALFGLGAGILVKNQVAAVLLTVGGTLILESAIVALVRHFTDISLNWLPSPAAASAAGSIGRQNSGGEVFNFLPWWGGALALLAWGVVPAVIGYFTTFRRDVT